MSFVIPTQYKSKLPQTHSYPLGAEAVSVALMNVPQLTRLELSFYHHHGHYHVKTPSDKPLDVITATYRNLDVGLTGSNAFVEEGWYQEHWELTVYAVPREKRARVKELLITDGLQRVAQWLSAPRSEVWRYGRKSCQIEYSLLDDALVIQED